ncbi:MAG TPA: transposase [Kofleriaceae bacterium]
MSPIIDNEFGEIIVGSSRTQRCTALDLALKQISPGICRCHIMPAMFFWIGHCQSCGRRYLSFMKACERNHVRRARQGELFAPRKRRGGRRPGAGRPCKGARAGAPHKQRPVLAARYPVHVVIRVAADVGTLRRLDLYRAIRKATQRVAKRDRFRLVHLSIQRTHMHLLVEADDKIALARGMQAFQISAARRINRMLSRHRPGRRGAVFPDRYHAEIITSPTQARHALSYVLNNWRKHREDRDADRLGWRIDWFSSAAAFDGWAEIARDRWMLRRPAKLEPLDVKKPETWLLSAGWKKCSPTISRTERPSAGGH